MGDLLEMSRINAGSLSVVIDLFDARNAVHAAMASVRRREPHLYDTARRPALWTSGDERRTDR